MKTIAGILLLLSASRQVHSQGTNLGGSITTRVDVQEYADLALDLRDIRNYAKQGQSDQILGLYEQGNHAELPPGFRWPLQKLNDDMATSAKRTPFYLFHLYGLAGLSQSETDLNDQSHYANNYIREVIEQNPTYAPDAILAVGMWMYASHLLFNGVAICEHRTNADSPDLFDLGGGGMDEFIAFWIGADQTSGEVDGHGLYTWTQTIGDTFGEDSPEATVNSNLKLLYQEGATILSINRACSASNTDSVEQLWKVATRMANEMVKPLYQWLIYYIVQEDAVAVSIYATALVPQLARCRPSIYKRLKERLLDNTVNFDVSDEILLDLQDSYTCFGLTCKDIGKYRADPRLECDKARVFRPLAGYRASTDVSALSRLDSDIYQLRILTSLQAKTFAHFWYNFGFNAPKLRENEKDPFELHSLNELAIMTDREYADPLYSQFVSYFGNQDYADYAVSAALSGSSKWKSQQQNTEVVALTSAFQILFMQVMAKLRRGVTDCKNNVDPDEVFWNPHPVDEAAAMLIGSMEGTALGGSADMDDGQLLYNLANKRAFQFDTMNKLSYANVNSEIEDMLYAAKGELDGLACANFERSVNRIEKLLTVGLFQSALRGVIDSQALPSTSPSSNLAEAEVFSLSLLPIIAANDKATAELIEENMIVREGVDTVRDGAQAVADGFGYAFTRDIGLPCRYLGSSSEVNPCQKYGDSSANSRSSFVWALGTGLLALNYML